MPPHKSQTNRGNDISHRKREESAIMSPPPVSTSFSQPTSLSSFREGRREENPFIHLSRTDPPLSSLLFPLLSPGKKLRKQEELERGGGRGRGRRRRLFPQERQQRREAGRRRFSLGSSFSPLFLSPFSNLRTPKNRTCK